MITTGFEYFISTIVVLGILIFVHELGHFIIAKLKRVKVIKFSLGFGPKIIGKRIGETEYVISAVPLGGYVKLLGEQQDEEIKDEDIDRAFVKKSVPARMAIIAAGPLSNLFFAFLIYVFVFVGYGEPILSTRVGDLTPNGPAKIAGIKKGDLIIAIDGKKVSKWEEMSKLIRQANGRIVVIQLKRDHKILTFKVKPQMREVKNIFGEKIKRYLIGITSSNEIVTKPVPPHLAIVKGAEATWQVLKLTILSIIKIFEGVISAKTIGGPIQIAKMAGETAQRSLLDLAILMAIISINLALLNLFPIPILDGGHLLFLLIEAVKGRPISTKKLEFAQYIGLMILISLMAFAFHNDISRLVSRK
ncbi:MAG: RIP metalloprotease RseP [Deltaproteobacteria bacterium]|nr:MAG: RIP metalloprotease RseP [Deltaproteobacteria bacterium]